MLRTCLKGFVQNFRRKKDWGDIWSLDGLYLNDAQARIFVNRAIAEGYEYDVDVPDEKVREWLGLPKRN